jgi:hypothetical protein
LGWDGATLDRLTGQKLLEKSKMFNKERGLGDE